MTTTQLSEVAEFLDHLRRPVSDAERRHRIAGKAASDLFPYFGANGQAGWIDSFLFDEPLVLLAEDGGAFGSASKPIAYRVDGKTWVNNHAHVLRPRPGVDVDFLCYALAIRPDVGSLTSGSTRAKLNRETAAAISVQMPSYQEQRRVAAGLSAQLATTNRVSEQAGSSRTAVSRLAGLVRSSLLDGLPGPRVPISALLTEPGAIIDGPFGSNLKGDHYQSSGIRVIRLGNIGLGFFVDVDRAYVTPAHAARLQRHRADVGDVVIAALGDGARPAGRACLVPPELSESIVKADCFRVRTAGSDLDGAFLMHVMNSPQTLEYIRGSTRGATRPRMNLQMLKGLEIPVPCMQEQRRIVAELDACLVEVSGIDSSIRVEQEAIDALPAALLRRAFDGLAA